MLRFFHRLVLQKVGFMILSPRFAQALTYASIAHSDQLRKGTEIPYISHLLAVAGLVLEHGGDEDEAIAALLHDAVEDAGGQARLANLRQRFGFTDGQLGMLTTGARSSSRVLSRRR